MGRDRKRKRHIVSELNITNLVDVTFALLIIFMITAPMMTQGVQVDLPEAEAQNVETNESIQISINSRSEIYIDDTPVSLSEFKTVFENKFHNRINIPVFINADKKVPYGLVVILLSQVQQVGAVKLGFMTLPPGKRNK